MKRLKITISGRESESICANYSMLWFTSADMDKASSPLATLVDVQNVVA